MIREAAHEANSEALPLAFAAQFNTACCSGVRR
jgi:hypothetical protein